MSVGTIYLLHFDRPLHHAKHYLGWAKDDPMDRVNDHLAGLSRVAIMRAAVAAGIHVELVRTWPADRTTERKLKNRKNARGLCPICRASYNEEAKLRMRRRRSLVTA